MCPESLYGPTKQVRAYVGRLATKVLQDDSLDVVLQEPLLDVAVYPGCVFSRGMINPPADQANFHADFFGRISNGAPSSNSVARKRPRRLTAMASTGLDRPGGSQAYCSRRDSLVKRASRQLQFLEHAREHWHTLVSVGHRYAPMGNLETTPTLVTYCLARQGAPILILRIFPLLRSASFTF